MTPLEAAKALAAMDPALMHFEQCVHCGEKQRDHGGAAYEIVHKPDCPWLHMSQIVRVLNIATHIVDYCDPTLTDGKTWRCAFCTATQADAATTDGEAFPHLRTCPWHALTAAVDGVAQ